NRTVKRLRANDSAATSVKVGYCQACIQKPPLEQFSGGFALRERKIHAQHQIKNNTNIININFKTSQHRGTEMHRGH
ncbi:hypothetical protein ACO0LM_11605, partial [Undibacterium sp. Di26W]|uniref:hypothetical protein n=1 Tax=Undibacterium sp. Di26W TaxID=3413035 RepID=UPI003BF29093